MSEGSHSSIVILRASRVAAGVAEIHRLASAGNQAPGLIWILRLRLRLRAE